MKWYGNYKNNNQKMCETTLFPECFLLNDKQSKIFLTLTDVKFPVAYTITPSNGQIRSKKYSTRFYFLKPRKTGKF